MVLRSPHAKTFSRAHQRNKASEVCTIYSSNFTLSNLVLSRTRMAFKAVDTGDAVPHGPSPYSSISSLLLYHTSEKYSARDGLLLVLGHASVG